VEFLQFNYGFSEEKPEWRLYDERNKKSRTFELIKQEVKLFTEKETKHSEPTLSICFLKDISPHILLVRRNPANPHCDVDINKMFSESAFANNPILELQ
jgi:hypothetical protein